MSPFKWLNNLLLFENFFGIYRTYSSQKNRKKHFILLQIFIQTMLNTLSVIYQLYLFLGRNDINQMKLISSLLSASTYINFVSSVVTSISYSRDFISYLRSISGVYGFLFGFYKDISSLINSIKKIVYTSIIIVLITFLCVAYRSTQAFIKYLPSDPIITLVLVLLPQIVMRMTVIFQHLMFYVFIMMVVLLIKCLSSLISAAQERVGSNSSSLDEQSDITKEKIQEWVELYRDLVNCCEKLTLCFGRQYFYSLTIYISQYILVAYQIFYTYLSTVEVNTDSNKIIVLFSYIIVMIMPLFAAQLTRNQGAKLHRMLVRLYNKKIIGSGEAEAKLMKDFIRLIKKNPLEIKVLSKSPSGLYMLPIIFTLGVNYLIVMLQFKHVI